MSRHRIVRAVSLCVAAASMSPPTPAASFACDKATTRVERLVCKDEELDRLDEYLGRYYTAARTQLASAEQCLSTDQRAWLRVRDACDDAACLKAAYLSRLAELDGVQPGATALKSVPFPAVPTLVGIVPPAADQVAAPRRANLEPLTVQGKLVDEVASGDGYVLVTAGNRKHVVVASMFIDDSTAVLESLSKQPATYRVQGRAEAGARGAKPFSQGSCRLIHRLPG